LIGIWRSSYRYQPVVRDGCDLAAKLHESLPDWLIEPETAKEIDENQAASVDIDVDTTETVTVG